MAKKNGRDDPPKPQVAENEQMSDIILILDKMELILQAVSQIDKDGRYKTVPADKEHTNSFLKIDRYASMLGRPGSDYIGLVPLTGLEPVLNLSDSLCDRGTAGTGGVLAGNLLGKTGHGHRTGAEL